MKRAIDADIAFSEKKIQDLHDVYVTEFRKTNDKGDLENIAGIMDEAAVLSERIGNNALLALSLWRKGAVLRSMAKYDLAETCYREAERVAEIYGLYSELSGVYDSLGNLFLDRGRLSEAQQYYSKAADIAKRHNLTARYIGAMGSAAHIMVKAGNNLEALRTCLQAIDICRKSETGVPAGIITHTAMAYTNLGEYQNALDIYAAYHESMARIGDPSVKATILNNIAAIHNLLEDNTSAIQIALEALEFCHTVQTGQVKLFLLMNLGIAYSKEKDFTKAYSYLDQADELAATLGMPLMNARLADARAQVSHADDKVETAAEYYSEQIRISREQDDMPLLMKGLCGLARISESPEALLNEALELAQERQQKKVLAEVYLIFAEHMAKKGDFSEAYRYHLLHHETTKEMLSEDAQRKKEILRVEYEVEKLRTELEQQKKEKTAAELELERRRQEFNQLAFQLSHSGRAIEAIRHHAASGMKSSSGKQRTYFRHIMQAANTQLSPAQWDMFENRFRQLHSDFIDSLRQKFPRLSPTEVKVCALIKSGCSTKEASSLLCISDATLESHRTAIRKKLNLTQGQNLQNFILALESSSDVSV